MNNQTTKIIVDSQAVIRCLDTSVAENLGSHTTFTVDELMDKIDKKTGLEISLEQANDILQKVRFSASYGIPRFQREINDVLPKESNAISLQEAQLIFSNIRTNHQYSSADFLEEFTEKTALNSFMSGIAVSLLQPGLKGWQKGKLKMCFQFTPEESESTSTEEKSMESSHSPLDEIRQLANN